MFLIEKVLKRLWKNRLIYLILVVELAIGTMFLGYSFQYSFSYLQDKKELEKSMSSETITIEIIEKSEQEEESSSFEYADYERIKDKVRNLEVYLCTHGLVDVQGEMKEIPFVFTNLMKDAKSFSVGEELSNDIAQKAQIYGDTENGWIEEKQMLYDGEEYRRVELPEALKAKVIARNVFEDNIYAEKSIFLPLKDLKAEQIVPSGQTIVRYEPKDMEHREKANQEVVEILSENHPEYSYGIQNYINNFEQVNERSLEYVKYMTALSLLGIWIMIFGYLGITKQLYVKRQKEYAICLSVGATVKNLICEMILENIVVLTAGVALGNIGIMYLLQYRKSEEMILDVTYQFETLLASVLLICLMGVIVNYSGYKKMRKLVPQEMIRNMYH